MRAIERSSAFKRDFKRVKANARHSRDIDALLASIVALLAVVHADVTALAAEGLLEREGGRLRADYDVIETKIAL